MLVLKYDAKNFFGIYELREDRKNNETFSDVKKVFSYLKKNNKAAANIDNVCIFWDNFSDFENDIMSVRTYDPNGNGLSYDQTKKSFDLVKKHYYKIYKEKEK